MKIIFSLENNFIYSVNVRKKLIFFLSSSTTITTIKGKITLKKILKINSNFFKRNPPFNR